MADVCITEFTDPACPWAWSAEPFRRRLSWIYGERLEWRTCMVVLADAPEEYLDKGFTPARQAESFRRISEDHGMPIDTRERPRMAATEPACRAVVAARMHAPERERLLLRRLRMRHFCGQLLDEAQTIADAARDAGIDPGELVGWAREAAVEEALAHDRARAREPLQAAQVLDHKLANWSGGVRYTCPSYEIVRISDGVRIAVPGFQPFAVYDVVTANLVPGVDRREPPEDVAEVLAWTGTPLATKEVAVVCDIPLHEARERLGRVASEQHVGFDGFWTLARTQGRFAAGGPTSGRHMAASGTP
ncbi:MAG TPA: DsbA family protein [Solirubrobacteraceae bacterium]|nr:DsbA family protein [Solirubrobacteraceae bacterium]